MGLGAGERQNGSGLRNEQVIRLYVLWGLLRPIFTRCKHTRWSVPTFSSRPEIPASTNNDNLCRTSSNRSRLPTRQAPTQSSTWMTPSAAQPSGRDSTKKSPNLEKPRGSTAALGRHPPAKTILFAIEALSTRSAMPTQSLPSIQPPLQVRRWMRAVNNMFRASSPWQ